MSCFIMSDQAHAATANALEYILNSGFNRFGFDAPDSLYKALSDCRDRCQRHEAGFFRSRFQLQQRIFVSSVAVYRDQNRRRLIRLNLTQAFHRAFRRPSSERRNGDHHRVLRTRFY